MPLIAVRFMKSIKNTSFPIEPAFKATFPQALIVLVGRSMDNLLQYSLRLLESTLLVGVGAVGLLFPWWCLLWLAAAVLALVKVVRLIGLVPSGLVLSGSSPALGFVLEDDGPLHHVLQPEGQ